MKRKSDSDPEHRNVRTRQEVVLGKRPSEGYYAPAKRTRVNGEYGYVPTVEELQMAMQHLIAREQAVTAREQAVLERERALPWPSIPQWTC